MNAMKDRFSRHESADQLGLIVRDKHSKELGYVKGMNIIETSPPTFELLVYCAKTRRYFPPVVSKEEYYDNYEIFRPKGISNRSSEA